MGYAVDPGTIPKVVVNSAGFGAIAWVSSAVALAAGQTSNWLAVGSFAHALPTNANLDGFTLAITGSSSVVGAISDVSVRLIRLGTSTAVNASNTFAWGTAYIRQLFAGSSNLMGFSTWAITDPNTSALASGHAWLLSVVNVSAASATFYMSSAESVVHYSVTDNTLRPGGVSTILGIGRC